MRAIIVGMLMLCTSPAFSEEAGCYLKNSGGDRFTFTDNDHVWHYQPALGADEYCAYGVDPDAGWFTITCPDHQIDAIVKSGKTRIEIGDVVFRRECPIVDLGL